MDAQVEVVISQVANGVQVIETNKKQPSGETKNYTSPSGSPKKQADGSGRRKSTGTPIELLSARAEFMKTAISATDIARLKNVCKAILLAENVDSLIDMLIASLELFPRTGKIQGYHTFSEYIRMYPDNNREAAIIQMCLRQISPKQASNIKAISTVGRAAIVTLGKIGSSVAESYLINILPKAEFATVRGDIIFALGKCGVGFNALKHVSSYIDADRVGERLAAFWAIGHIGTREREDPIKAGLLDEVITCLGKASVTEDHLGAKKFAIYALGELCDQRNHTPEDVVVRKELADYVLMVFEQVSKQIASVGKGVEEERQNRHFLEIANMMVRGTTLSESQVESLMAIRSLMSVVGEPPTADLN
jgi:hypothetical protein